jgi:hypothetical protein
LQCAEQKAKDDAMKKVLSSLIAATVINVEQQKGAAIFRIPSHEVHLKTKQS